MIRDRIKKRLRRAAIKALGMEEQAEDRKEQEHRDVAFDPKYIPKLQIIYGHCHLGSQAGTNVKNPL